MEDIQMLKRRLEREVAARKQAESILESKAKELYSTNQQLIELNQQLEQRVTERTRQLTESEQRYRILVENAHDIIYTSDSDGYILYTNGIAEEILGYATEEILGNHFTDFVVPEFAEKTMEFYIGMRDEIVPDSYLELPVVTKTGEVVWLGQNVKRVLIDDHLTFTIVARNITERKEIENALQIAQKTLSLSEQKYRSMIENMKLGILEVDTNGQVIKAYDGFCEMVEYEPEELIGKNPESFLLNDRARKIISEQHEKREDGIAEIYEIPVITKSGKEKWMLISGAPFYNLDDEVAGSIGIHYDITYQKKLQEQLEIEKRKAESAQAAEQQFLANMSHEIRTPLNAVIGMSHLLQTTDLNEEQTEFLNILSSSADLLLTLISDILDISKIDAGHIDLKRVPIDLPGIIRNVMDSFSMKAKKKGLELIVEIDEDIQTQVISDELLLNQILINLVGNAVKFTHEGRVMLSVKIRNRTPNEMTIQFEISDTGIGISEEAKPSIFKKFKRDADLNERKYSGTGLGLSISKSLVEILGGTISFTSKKNIGTTFIATIPFVDTQVKLDEPKISEPVENVPVFKDVHLLIAEDNKLNQKYISTLMDKWGLVYDLVEDGLEVIEAAGLAKYDLIFMDLQMPKLGGLEAAKKIRSQGLNRQTPIIALTASTFLSKKQMAKEAGMNDFLTKPYTPTQLLKVITRHVRCEFKLNRKEYNIPFSTQLDHAVLEEIYGDDHEYAIEMFHLFLAQINDQRDQLDAFIQEGKFQHARALTHKMRPTFKMIGLSKMTDLMGRLEEALECNELDQVKNIYKQVHEELPGVIVLVRKQMEILQSQLKVQNS